jgi:hypothetical protein
MVCLTTKNDGLTTNGQQRQFLLNQVKIVLNGKVKMFFKIFVLQQLLNTVLPIILI